MELIMHARFILPATYGTNHRPQKVICFKHAVEHAIAGDKVEVEVDDIVSACEECQQEKHRKGS